MKKAFLFSVLLFCTLFTVAQNPQLDKLKKELKDHPALDTFRVNRLNDLADNTSLQINERKEFANEAYESSKKISYSEGEGYSLIILGSLQLR